VGGNLLEQNLMMREEPSLETLWLQNIRMMDKVQIIDHSNQTACLQSPLF
jgi:hypothetical protein